MSLITSILTGGSNNHQTTSEEANAGYTDLLAEGVVGVLTNTAGVAPATGGFAVNAQGTPDATVAVSSGVAYVTGTPTSQSSQTFRVKNTASVDVAITSNSSGSTKYDWVYIKLDATKLNTPNTAADDVATIVTSRSSSASTDDGTPPTYGYCIAVVTVANGFSTITNGNITDKRYLVTNLHNPTLKATRYYTSSTTWTKPIAMTDNGFVEIEVLGGGGGSGGVAGNATGQGLSGCGGAGGRSFKKVSSSLLGSTETVTVGAAGTAGSSGNNAGGTGGTSSFGSHCSATGGAGGTGMTATTGSSTADGGNGGTGSSGDLNTSGANGANGRVAIGAAMPSGTGGSSPYGGGGRSISSGTGAGNAASGYGSGGGSSLAASSSVAGAAGTAGLVIVKEYY